MFWVDVFMFFFRDFQGFLFLLTLLNVGKIKVLEMVLGFLWGFWGKFILKY